MWWKKGDEEEMCYRVIKRCPAPIVCVVVEMDFVLDYLLYLNECVLSF